jgi:hypothetical protein
MSPPAIANGTLYSLQECNGIRAQNGQSAIANFHTLKANFEVES